MFKSSKDMPKSFQSHLLLEILVYGRKLDLCYKEYFVEYLNNPADHVCMNSERVTNYYDSNWCRYYSNVSSRADTSYIESEFHKKLLFYYIEVLYRANVDVSEWQKFFNKHDYKCIMSEIKFLNGEEIRHEDLDNIESLGSKVMIEILESNPESYKVNDKVKILCDLKNTPKVYIKIYEFNAENYYRAKMAEFNCQIDLDGLEPTFERVEEFKESVQKKFRHLFDIPEIQKKPGLYVIDFISNGISSRAVVKKGSLSLVHTVAREGHICHILDEDRNICHDKSTAIWFSNKYFKSDEKGKIVIPYAKNYCNYQVCLISKGIAALTPFTQQYENYNFECYFNLNHESLLMGKNATAIITPVLSINNQKCSLDLIKNLEVRITMKSYIDDLPMTKVFDNIDFNDGKDIVVNFQIPPNLGSLEITVNAEVANLTKGI
jgi:hypothetical protein